MGWHSGRPYSPMGLVGNECRRYMLKPICELLHTLGPLEREANPALGGTPLPSLFRFLKTQLLIIGDCQFQAFLRSGFG